VQARIQVDGLFASGSRAFHERENPCEREY
jgi:hypothetical protein